MTLLTPDLRAALRAKAIAHHDAMQLGTAEPDAIPVVKFFNPCGAATWLASELYEDGDTLLGLADLGFGCPELGVFSLTKIASVRLPYGLRIERDLHFIGRFPLTLYADAARIAGQITEDERLLNAAALARKQPRNSDIPRIPHG